MHFYCIACILLSNTAKWSLCTSVRHSAAVYRYFIWKLSSLLSRVCKDTKCSRLDNFHPNNQGQSVDRRDGEELCVNARKEVVHSQHSDEHHWKPLSSAFDALQLPLWRGWGCWWRQVTETFSWSIVERVLCPWPKSSVFSAQYTLHRCLQRSTAGRKCALYGDSRRALQTPK